MGIHMEVLVGLVEAMDHILPKALMNKIDRYIEVLKDQVKIMDHILVDTEQIMVVLMYQEEIMDRIPVIVTLVDHYLIMFTAKSVLHCYRLLAVSKHSNI
uniref:Uncharacterized protein n=1 Tax=Acrobeloides nanus TaxID=290746 RepID=A0A914CK88_9BILA